MEAKDGFSRRVRRGFGKIDKIIDIPNLIEVQKKSYDRFLQKDIAPEERREIGLQGAFRSVFPISDFSGTSSLEFVKYAFEDLKYDEEECLNKGMTYEAPLKLTVRLLVFDTDETDGTKVPPKESDNVIPGQEESDEQTPKLKGADESANSIVD